MARKGLEAVLVLTVVSGCFTTPKERCVTDIYRDAGDGLSLAVSVEKESAQQFGYHLLPYSYLLFWFPPLCFGNEWEIRRKENLVYRLGDAKDVVREEREVLIEATKTLFPWLATLDMVEQQEAIFRNVLTTVDDARRNAAGTVAQGVLCEDVLRACEQRATADLGGDALGTAAEGEPLVRTLARLPYTVERTDRPASRGSAVEPHTQVQVSGMGGYRITTTTTTLIRSMQLEGRNSTCKVRVVRRFTAAKSGKLLGTVDDTYVLHLEQVSGDGVCQTLLK